jgi:hypothetical protein
MNETPRGFAIFSSNAAFCPFFVEFHLSAKKIVLVEIPQQKISVVYTGIGAALAITDSPGAAPELSGPT